MIFGTVRRKLTALVAWPMRTVPLSCAMTAVAGDRAGRLTSAPRKLRRSRTITVYPSGWRSAMAGCQRNTRRSTRDASILAPTTKASNTAMPAKTPAGS